VAAAGAEAIRAARSAGGQVATLILPADASWGVAETAAAVALDPPPLYRPDAARVRAAVDALRRPGAALLVSGPALYGALALLAGQIAARCGCRLLAPYFAPRIACGAGTVAFEVMPYPVRMVMGFLGGLSQIICVGEAPPVAFFAYPGLPSTPEPVDCAVQRLCEPGEDVAWVLGEMARLLGVDGSEAIALQAAHLPDLGAGQLTPDKIGRALAVHLPQGAIVVNEALTSGVGLWEHLDGAAAHDRLCNTGGSIGQCLPNAVGAAVACPDRPVFAVSGDGSAMYQLQSLWTMAREALDVTVIILSNGGYRILHMELANLGLPAPGENARRMFDLANPSLDWVALAKGHGVPGVRAETAEELAAALRQAAETRGPFLIEAML
jgi:acetolactate synthase I/II/III large subunit